ncbi:MAG: hypothetical protein HUK25_05650 [Treponema sp.]|nr:hypothetical protein [Treponema sp.]
MFFSVFFRNFPKQQKIVSKIIFLIHYIIF